MSNAAKRCSLWGSRVEAAEESVVAEGPVYQVSFEVRVDPDVWFQLATISELPSEIADWTTDDLFRALRNEAIVISEGSLLLTPIAG